MEGYNKEEDGHGQERLGITGSVLIVCYSGSASLYGAFVCALIPLLNSVCWQVWIVRPNFLPAPQFEDESACKGSKGVGVSLFALPLKCLSHESRRDLSMTPIWGIISVHLHAALI